MGLGPEVKGEPQGGLNLEDNLGGQPEVEPRQFLEAPNPSQALSCGTLHGLGWEKL